MDGPAAKVREAVHIVIAGERVRPNYAEPAPDVHEVERADAYYVTALEALVRMKLTSFRDKDRTHLRDLLGVGLINASWGTRLPVQSAARLQE